MRWIHKFDKKDNFLRWRTFSLSDKITEEVAGTSGRQQLNEKSDLVIFLAKAKYEKITSFLQSDRVYPLEDRRKLTKCSKMIAPRNNKNLFVVF